MAAWRALLVAVLSLVASAAMAQSQGHVSDMSCADYLKAEQASGFTEGVTGKPGIDRLSTGQASRVHDFCTANPTRNAGDAIQRAKPKQ